MKNDRNWAGNYRYSASEFLVPENVEQVQELVARSSQIKVLGTRHSLTASPIVREAFSRFRSLTEY